MKGGVKGKRMVITIDVKNPQKITVANEEGKKVKPVPIDTLRDLPLDGVRYVDSAAVLGKKASEECIILIIFGQMFVI